MAHRLDAAPHERFAGLRVLLRSQAPRHPPRTLFRLWTLSWALVHRCHCRHDSLRAYATSVLQFALALGKIEVINQLYGCKSAVLSQASKPQQLACGKPPENSLFCICFRNQAS